MIKKNGILTFKSDLKPDGTEILNSTQRNNQISWPSPNKFPKSQIIVSWKNTCNVTSIVMGLEYSGWNFPVGQYSQPEDNLAKFILESEEIDSLYAKKLPAMYSSYKRALNGQCSPSELNNVYTPIELHEFLAKGTNLWLGSTAVEFRTNINFKKALWSSMVESNLPIVLSTTFGGFGHVVTCVGFSITESEYEKALSYRKKTNELPDDYEIESIIVDDPWGNASKSKFASYPAGGGGSGNNLTVPWDIVVSRVKPVNSTLVKWGHMFKHGIATV